MPVSEAGSRDSIKLHTYIRNCSRYMSRGHEAAVKSCFIHTSGNVVGTIIRSSQQGQNLFTHTHSQPQLLRVPGTCSRKVSHCLSSSYNTISHRCFVTSTCLAKVHLVELHVACCSNERCKGRFLSREQLGGVRPQLTERFNKSQA